MVSNRPSGKPWGAAPGRRALEDIRGTLLALPALWSRRPRGCGSSLAPATTSSSCSSPGIMARLGREAPGVELRVVALKDDLGSDLASGKLDVVLMPPLPGEEGPSIHYLQVLSERFVCVARRDHPLAKKRALTLSRFAAASHVLIAPWGMEGGLVDDALARLGLKRRVTVALPHAMVAPHVVASTDLLLTMPERVARVLAPPLGLAVLEPPPELLLTGFAISMLWHERTDGDLARRWLRDVIVAEAAERSLQ